MPNQLLVAHFVSNVGPVVCGLDDHRVPQAQAFDDGSLNARGGRCLQMSVMAGADTPSTRPAEYTLQIQWHAQDIKAAL